MSDRILTTHVGSLPRPADVSELLFKQAADEAVDDAVFDATVARAVIDVVALQKKAGVDIPSDGEMSKVSYATYVSERLTGFSGDSPRRVPGDLLLVPKFMNRLVATGATPQARRPCCTGDIRVRTTAPLEADIFHFQAALSASGYAQGFMNAAAPGIITLFQPNRHYATEDAYLEALAAAMAPEFRRIVEAGLILQVDSPDLALGRHVRFGELTDDAFVRQIGTHAAVLNAALSGIPPERVRLHLCWGNYEGPHTLDIPLERILPTALGITAGALSFEGANPRHGHEWRVFREIKIPEDRVLIPGVIDSCTNYVEHPDLVAERILRYADIVGRERVIAGTDCGFATFAGFGPIDPDVTWMKLGALAEGARRASKVLYS